MMKKLLVVGDSFMRPDPVYIGRHWSEMLPDYEVLMYSESGASNGIIAHHFYSALKSEQPDAVVIGMSAADRIEFKVDQQPGLEKKRWVTGTSLGLNSVQKLAVDYYKLAACTEMQSFKSIVLARSMFLTLEKIGIPYAYSLNLLGNDLENFTLMAMLNEHLGEFKEHECPTNLATYPNWKASPGFHTDDPAWQKRFAAEVDAILSKTC